VLEKGVFESIPVRGEVLERVAAQLGI